jgi:hypothetical protein
MKRKRRQPPRRGKKLVVLDAFSSVELQSWLDQGETSQWLVDRIYFELEQQRIAHYDALCSALRSVPGIAVEIDGWARVTDWRWNLSPLSPEGSLNGVGGRFNIGADLDRARNQAFPSLYIADSVDTAFSEYFGGALSTKVGYLNLGELALRRASSFTTFVLRGALEQVLDLRTDRALRPFAAIVNQFDISPTTKWAVRKAGLPPRPIIRSSHQLWTQLLDGPENWRREPQVYGIPAACQIFGKFVRDAGFEAILYPSRRGEGNCLAIYPSNFIASSGHVEVIGPGPPGATHTILDQDHLR